MWAFDPKSPRMNGGGVRWRIVAFGAAVVVEVMADSADISRSPTTICSASLN
jgi:hypothetical protein